MISSALYPLIKRAHGDPLTGVRNRDLFRADVPSRDVSLGVEHEYRVVHDALDEQATVIPPRARARRRGAARWSC
jgi:hypothetical protein